MCGLHKTPWRGIEGIVNETRASARLIIWLNALMQGMSVNIDAAQLEPFKESSEFTNIESAPCGFETIQIIASLALNGTERAEP
jgi:hypothetical protein